MHYPSFLGAINLTREQFHSIDAPSAITTVECTGSEETLLSCSHSRQPQCSELDDAGVVCQGQLTAMYYTSVKIALSWVLYAWLIRIRYFVFLAVYIMFC